MKSIAALISSWCLSAKTQRRNGDQEMGGHHQSPTINVELRH